MLPCALAVGATIWQVKMLSKYSEPARAGLVHEDIASKVDLAAEFERVRAFEERDAVDQLELLGGLEFRQKVRRAYKGAFGIEVSL